MNHVVFDKCLLKRRHLVVLQLMNTVPIKSWSGAPEDRELQKLIPYMEKLATAVSLLLRLLQFTV